MEKVTFNYKMYRWACIIAWLVVLIGFITAMISPITLEETSRAGYIMGSIAMLIMLGAGALGIAWEMKGWFKKIEKKESVL